MRTPFYKQRGVTLAETVVYATVLAILFVVVVNGLIQLTRTYRSLSVSRALTISSVSLMERMVYEIRQANDVDQVNSVFGTSPGKLVLTTTASNGSATTVEFSVATSSLVVKQGGVLLGPLSSASTTIDSLIFRLITNANTSKAVRIEAQISATNGGYSKTAKLYNTVILRGSY
ncbi:MAG: hypothetical protein RLZZ347_521 [Candidatus Parcubacteria bacterium]|jgi:Tfp pilus assembly protein PilE